MNIDRILKIFVPKDHEFYPLFEKGANNLIKAADLLKILLATETIEKREEIIRQIKDTELTGDEITHKIFEQLNKSFITPFDREDIQELASNMDDVVDYINGTGQRIKLFKPRTFPAHCIDMADIIIESTKEIQKSIDNLKDPASNIEKITQSCININTLENKADDLYHNGISLLFQNEPDATELIKKKEILETMEKSIDKAEDVSDTIKTILIKMS